MNSETPTPDVPKEGTLKKWLPLLFTVGLMLFIFGVVLPRFIDYEAGGPAGKPTIQRRRTSESPRP